MVLRPETRIEDYIQDHPDLVGFLIQHNLPCVVCGEPFWGTLAELADQKGWDENRLMDLISDFNKLLP
ncbi:MAG: hypothetical protein KOO62_00480 [candidate division Zixibacteria bacterium]|nr:hypothetical protein [candidate division Zixibacteria bacterium]